MSYTFSPNLLRRGTKCCKRHAVVFLGEEGTRTAVGGLRSAGAQFTELVSVSSGTRLTGLASVRSDLPFPADRTYRQKRSGSPPFILIHAPSLHSAVAVTSVLRHPCHRRRYPPPVYSSGDFPSPFSAPTPRLLRPAAAAASCVRPAIPAGHRPASQPPPFLAIRILRRLQLRTPTIRYRTPPTPNAGPLQHQSLDIASALFFQLATNLHVPAAVVHPRQ